MFWSWKYILKELKFGVNQQNWRNFHCCPFSPHVTKNQDANHFFLKLRPPKISGYASVVEWNKKNFEIQTPLWNDNLGLTTIHCALLDTLRFVFCIRNSKSQWAYNAGAAINCVFHLPRNFFQIFCNHTTATGVALIHSRKKIYQPPKGDFLHEYSLQN